MTQRSRSYCSRLARFLPRRRYSVLEIADMRMAVSRLNYSMARPQSYSPAEFSAKIERQVWTHIHNGTPVSELTAAADKWEKDDRAAYHREMAERQKAAQ